MPKKKYTIIDETALLMKELKDKPVVIKKMKVHRTPQWVVLLDNNPVLFATSEAEILQSAKRYKIKESDIAYG